MSDNEIIAEITSEDKAAFDAMRDEKPIASEPEPETEEVEEESTEDEPEPDKAEKPEPEKKKDGRVPLRKLREEEERRKSLEKELSEQREIMARADERLRILAEVNKPRQEEQAPPDPDQDPIAALKWVQEQQRKADEQREHFAREQQERAYIEQIDGSYRSGWKAYQQDVPDAADAYRHWITAMDGYFDSVGLPEAQRNEAIIREERRIALAAQSRGMNPAGMIYRQAEKFGYRKAEAPEPAKDAEKEVERRQKAAPAARSLSNAGGVKGGEITVQDLATMSEEEFAEMRAKMSPRAFERLLGG
jgi:hypothetical protein